MKLRESLEQPVREKQRSYAYYYDLLIPKRYAVTSTHLFADGQRYEWNRLRLAKKQPKKRIMLLRKGWGPFGPLPLGGDRSALDKAALLIVTILQEEE